MDLRHALITNSNPFDLALLWDAAEVLPLKGFVVAHGSTQVVQLWLLAVE